jgi:pimeloyl-ACP methyl ester carboxylesterase
MSGARTCRATLAVLAVVVPALVFAGCGGHAAAKSRTVPGDPGLEYEVHGNYLYLVCAGHGSPTVVLEAGLGEDHRDWSLVQPELAQTTRVCSYDRAGLGLSQLAPKRHTALEKARDLHGLLEAAGVDGPFVLVGHSYGGMLARVYAAAYPKDVAGLVLLDSSHPDQVRRFLATLPRKGESRVLRELRKSLTATRNPEGVNWKASSEEDRAAGSLGDRPLVVVTAGEFETPPELASFPAIVHGFRRAWLGMQDDLARLSTNHVHVVAVYSPHMVMTALGQPELVLHAIRAVVTAARDQDRLPACRALFKPPAARCV